MKKLFKGLFGIALIGGIAAAVYYYFSGDKYSDIEEFDEETYDDLQDFLDNEKGGDADEHYVSLDLTKDKASDDDKIIGEVSEESDSRIVKADSDQSEDVEGFSFSDLTE